MHRELLQRLLLCWNAVYLFSHDCAEMLLGPSGWGVRKKVGVNINRSGSRTFFFFIYCSLLHFFLLSTVSNFYIGTKMPWSVKYVALSFLFRRTLNQSSSDTVDGRSGWIILLEWYSSCTSVNIPFHLCIGLIHKNPILFNAWYRSTFTFTAMDYVGSIAAINRIVRQLGHSLMVNDKKIIHKVPRKYPKGCFIISLVFKLTEAKTTRRKPQGCDPYSNQWMGTLVEIIKLFSVIIEKSSR